MTKPTRARLIGLTSIVFAVLAANALDVRSAVVAVLASAALAAAFQGAAARVSDVPAGRSSAVAAISAALAAFVLVRFPSPWVDLGPFGAGPLTAIAIVVLPAAQIAALVSVSRGAWRTPPSSRQP